MRNNVRNYTAVFFGIVPIEKGQAFLPVLLVWHPLKRYKYEFSPHTILTNEQKNAILFVEKV